MGEINNSSLQKNFEINLMERDEEFSGLRKGVVPLHTQVSVNTASGQQSQLNSQRNGCTTDREIQEDMQRQREKIAYEHEFNEMNLEMEKMLEQMNQSRFENNMAG